VFLMYINVNPALAVHVPCEYCRLQPSSWQVVTLVLGAEGQPMSVSWEVFTVT